MNPLMKLFMIFVSVPWDRDSDPRHKLNKIGLKERDIRKKQIFFSNHIKFANNHLLKLKQGMKLNEIEWPTSRGGQT